MTVTVKEKGVYMLWRGEEIVGFFTRDEKSNENVVFIAKKASLDDIEKLFNNEVKL